MISLRYAFMLALSAGSMLMASDARAANALNGFCWGITPACLVNGAGTNSPTGSLNPNFGFYVTTGTPTGDYWIDVLVPDNEDATPAALSFNITGSQGGINNNLAISATASLVDPTKWNSGQLDAYLGITATPNQGINSYLKDANGTQSLDPGAKGYYVYKADLGTTKLFGQANELKGPLLTLGGNSLPVGSYIVGFLNTGSVASPTWVATTDADAIFATPEPASMTLFAFSGGALAYLRRRRR